MTAPAHIEIEWTTALKRKLTPWRGSPNKPKSLRRPKRTGPSVFRDEHDHSHMSPRDTWTDVAIAAGARGEALTGDDPLSAEFEAMYLLRTSMNMKSFTKGLFAAADASWVLDMLAQVGLLRDELYGRGSSQRSSTWYAQRDSLGMLGYVRRHLAGTKQPEYDAAMARAKELWIEREDDLCFRLQLAYLFPDQPDWGDAVARAWPTIYTAAADEIPDYYYKAMLIYSTGASTQRLLELNAKLFAPEPDDVGRNYYYRRNDEEWHVLFDALDIRGVEAMTSLIDLYERFADNATVFPLTEALCLIPHPDVARVFATDLWKRRTWYNVRSDMCNAYLLANPSISLGPVEEAIAEATQDPWRLEALVEDIRSKHAVIAKEDAHAELFVSRDELPRGLASPPWRDASIKRKKRRKYDPDAYADLEMIPCETLHSLGDGDPEHDARAKSARGGKSEAKILEALRAGVEDVGRVNYAHVYEAENLSRASCLELLESLSEDVLVRTSSSWTICEMCVKTIGADALAFIERRATLLESDAYDRTLLDHVSSPHLVHHIAYGLGRARRRHALSWIHENAKITAVGAIPGLLKAQDAKSRNGFIEALCVAYAHQPEVVQEVIDAYGDEVAHVLPDLDVYLQCPKKMPKLPSFWAPELWTPIVLAADPTRLLPSEVYEDIGFMLKFSPLGVPYVGLRELGEVADETSLAQFAWDLFQAWVDADAPNKEFWVVQALSLFGGAQMADNLAHYTDRWNDSKYKARSEKVLESLQNDENPYVIETLWRLQVGGYSELSRYDHALRHAKHITGLDHDIETITDLRTPTFGMDRARKLPLVEGSDLEVWFDEDLEPHLRTPDKVAAKLDPTTQLRWARIQSLCARQSQFQALRFERAMKTRRRWDPRTWRAHVLDHPLLGLLARGLVWGSYERVNEYDTKGTLVGTWRIDEAFDVVDLQDDTVSLDEDHFIGVVHPTQLSRQDLKSWTQLMSDYEIVQPFSQLGRSSVDVTGEQLEQLLAELDGNTTTLGVIQSLYYLNDWSGKSGRKRQTPVSYLERDLSNDHTGHEFGAFISFSPGFTSPGYKPIQEMSEPVTLSAGGTVKKLKRHTWEKISSFDRAELHHELTGLMAAAPD